MATESLATVHYRGADPVASLVQRRVRQSDQSRLRQALRDVGFDLDQMSFETDQRDGPSLGERHQAAPLT